MGNQIGPRQVGVATEQAGARLAGFVANLVVRPIEVQPIRLLEVVATDSPDAVLAQELLRVEHALQQALHAVTTYQCQQSPLAHAGLVPARDESSQVGPMIQEPVHAPLEVRQTLQQLGLDGLHGRSGIKPTSERTLRRSKWPSGRSSYARSSRASSSALENMFRQYMPIQAVPSA